MKHREDTYETNGSVVASSQSLPEILMDLEEIDIVTIPEYLKLYNNSV